jgi:hypothetical protein
MFEDYYKIFLYCVAAIFIFCITSALWLNDVRIKEENKALPLYTMAAGRFLK